MTNVEEKTRDQMVNALLEGLGISRGVVVGTDAMGTTKTYYLKTEVRDLAVYSKILDKSVFDALDRGAKHD